MPREKRIKKQTSSHFLKRNNKYLHLVSIEIKIVDGERWVVDEWSEWDETFGKGDEMTNKMRMEKIAKVGVKCDAINSFSRREMSRECVVGKGWASEKMIAWIRERKN